METSNTRFNLTLPLRQMQVKRMLDGHRFRGANILL